MSDRSLTLASLFPSTPRLDASELKLQRSAGSGESGLLDFIGAKAQEGVAEALDVDVLGLVAQGWSKVDDLRGVAEQTLRTGQPAHVFLGKHELTCDNQLDVVLEFAAVPAVTDHLQLRLVALFESVGLTIERGCIAAIDAGRGSARAELRYSSAKLLGQSTDAVVLPRRWRLERPVAVERVPTVEAVAPGPAPAA